jgi:hypothetical protein
MSRLADRIAKLERSRGNGYVAFRFLPFDRERTVADYERLKEQTLDKMIAAGEITEQQSDKVFFVRFLAADEVERSGSGSPIPRRRSLEKVRAAPENRSKPSARLIFTRR